MASLHIELGDTSSSLTVVKLRFRTIDGPDLHEITLPTEDAIDLRDRYRPRIETHVMQKASK